MSSKGGGPSAKETLEHFLKMSAAQLRHRLSLTEKNETYSERINRMRMLEELIKEQLPDENPGTPTSSAR